jgi:hypothetical protein
MSYRVYRETVVRCSIQLPVRLLYELLFAKHRRPGPPKATNNHKVTLKLLHPQDYGLKSLIQALAWKEWTLLYCLSRSSKVDLSIRVVDSLELSLWSLTLIRLLLQERSGSLGKA